MYGRGGRGGFLGRRRCPWIFPPARAEVAVGGGGGTAGAAVDLQRRRRIRRRRRRQRRLVTHAHALDLFLSRGRRPRQGRGRDPAAEAVTSGEIRVVAGRHRARDPLAAAQKHFARLGTRPDAGPQRRPDLRRPPLPQLRHRRRPGHPRQMRRCLLDRGRRKCPPISSRAISPRACSPASAKPPARSRPTFPRPAGAPNQLPDEIEEVD